MMIRKLIAALLVAMILVILTSAWMPEEARAQCVAGLNGLICSNPPPPSGAPSGGSSGDSHKRPAKSRLPTTTSTPAPTPVLSPTSLPPIGQSGPAAGNAPVNVTAAQNLRRGSSGHPWAATVVGYLFLAVIMILVPTAAGLIVLGKRHWLNPLFVRGNSSIGRDVATGLPSGKRNYPKASTATRDWAQEGTGGNQSQESEPIPLPHPAAPSPLPTPYPNVALGDNPVSKVEPSDIPITKTMDKGSTRLVK